MKLSLFSLVLLIVAGIESIRTLPSTAVFGSSLIFYYLLSAVIFLIPVAFVSAEFASRYPEEGGVFHWIRRAFGDRAGVLAVWLQWINTMVWYPTMLVFLSGTAAYLIDPALAQDKIYLLGASLCIFWSMTFLNLRGIQVSARMNSFCGSAGTLIPMCVLIGLGAWWVFSGKPLAGSFSWSEIVPSSNWLDGSSALVTIMASFLGMELAGVYVGDIQNPQKNFPKAIAASVAILMGTMVLGAVAIALVIPREGINFADGVMQTFSTFFEAFQVPFLVPVLAVLIIVGGAGGSVNWLLSPAKGLEQAAEQGFLPSYFLKKNRFGVASRILILQAMVVSTFCFAIQFIPNVNSYYWFLMALSTGLYMVMYILLFLAALKLKRAKEGYQIPRGMRTASCVAGLLACALGAMPLLDALRRNWRQPQWRLRAAVALLVALLFEDLPDVADWGRMKAPLLRMALEKP